MATSGNGYKKFVGVTGNDYPNKRREPRAVTPAFAVRAVGECQHTYGYTRDLSASGIQLRTFGFCSSEPKPAGELVELEFSLPDSGPKISCSAKVMWNVAPPHGPGSINLQGLVFVDMPPELRTRIGDWVDSTMAA